MRYDVAIIGAGICGTSAAYFLKQKGLRVLLIDKEAIASGGSGAAGAFISPKISKQGPINQLSHKAYTFSLEFYKKNFPHLITLSKLHHITPQKESIELNESGLVNAKEMCESLAFACDFLQKEVISLDLIDADKIIIATGAYTPLMPKLYLQLRAIFGHRIDIRSSTKVPHHFHEEVSISQSKKCADKECLSIGATHDVHQKMGMAYDVAIGRKILLEKANKTIHLQDVEILKDYTGFRSGSNDYMPHLGLYVDEVQTIKNEPQIRHGKKCTKLFYHKNIYTFNGLGGYGFVLAPYLAEKLANHIVEGTPLENEFLIERFFKRWVKKS